MYRGASNTRLNSMDPSHSNHGHPHSYSSPGNGRKGNISSRYPSNLNSTPTSKMDSNNSRNNNDNAAADENIMHMKKSAEIAAIFSGAKINQTTDILDPIHQHSRTNENYNGDRNRLRQSYHGGQQQRIGREENNGDNNNKNRLSSNKIPSSNQNRKLHSLAPQEMFSEADMHSSLGYFP